MKESKAYIKGEKLLLEIDERNLLLIKSVSKISGCKYHVLKKVYEFPLSYKNVCLLNEMNILFDKELRDWQRVKRNEKSLEQLKIKDIPELNGKLYPYQTLGVQWIEECDGRALIADEMGLGKTLQSIAWCVLYKNKSFPILVICPSFLKINWQREIEMWTNCRNIQILESRTPYPITGEWVLINYDILDSWVEEIKAYRFQTLIVDEAQYLKNSNTKRVKAFKRLSKTVPNLIALTGTPIENKPVEIFNIVNALNSLVFPDYYKFVKQFCDAKNGPFGFDVSGSSNTLELNRILTSTVMIRRKKSEVLPDLPPMQISTVPMEITNRKEYKQAEKRFIEFVHEKFAKDLTKEGIEKELKGYAKKHNLTVNETLTNHDIANIQQLKIEKSKAAPVLVQMVALEQLAVEGKMKAIVEWIENFLESGKKLVVVATNTIIIDYLMKHFPNAARVDGSVRGKKRQSAIDSFQENENTRLMFMNILAGGIGLNLTAANDLALVQFPWNPGKLVQASARVHRLTTTKKVTIYNIIAIDTIEEKKVKVLALKEKIMNETIDGGKYSDAAIASEVIKMYKS